MKVVIAFSALMAVALAAPPQLEHLIARPTQLGQHQKPQEKPHHPDHVVVSKLTPSNNNGLGNYHFAFEQNDGQAREESAELVGVGKDQHALRVKGSYTWTDPISKHTYTVHYEADEYGFRPQGAHLPA